MNTKPKTKSTIPKGTLRLFLGVILIALTVTALTVTASAEQATDSIVNLVSGGSLSPAKLLPVSGGDAWSAKSGVRVYLVDETGDRVSDVIDLAYGSHKTRALETARHFNYGTRKEYLNGASLTESKVKYQVRNLPESDDIAVPTIVASAASLTTAQAEAHTQELLTYFYTEKVQSGIAKYFSTTREAVKANGWVIAIEPVAYVTYDFVRYAVTPTELAMLNASLTDSTTRYVHWYNGASHVMYKQVYDAYTSGAVIDDVLEKIAAWNQFAIGGTTDNYSSGTVEIYGTQAKGTYTNTNFIKINGQTYYFVHREVNIPANTTRPYEVISNTKNSFFALDGSCKHQILLDSYNTFISTYNITVQSDNTCDPGWSDYTIYNGIGNNFCANAFPYSVLMPASSIGFTAYTNTLPQYLSYIDYKSNPWGIGIASIYFLEDEDAEKEYKYIYCLEDEAGNAVATLSGEADTPSHEFGSTYTYPHPTQASLRVTYTAEAACIFSSGTEPTYASSTTYNDLVGECALLNKWSRRKVDVAGLCYTATFNEENSCYSYNYIIVKFVYYDTPAAPIKLINFFEYTNNRDVTTYQNSARSPSNVTYDNLPNVSVDAAGKATLPLTVSFSGEVYTLKEYGYFSHQTVKLRPAASNSFAAFYTACVQNYPTGDILKANASASGDTVTVQLTTDKEHNTLFTRYVKKELNTSYSIKSLQFYEDTFTDNTLRPAVTTTTYANKLNQVGSYSSLVDVAPNNNSITIIADTGYTIKGYFVASTSTSVSAPLATTSISSYMTTVSSSTSRMQIIKSYTACNTNALTFTLAVSNLSASNKYVVCTRQVKSSSNNVISPVKVTSVTSASATIDDEHLTQSVEASYATSKIAVHVTGAAPTTVNKTWNSQYVDISPADINWVTGSEAHSGLTLANPFKYGWTCTNCGKAIGSFNDTSNMSASARTEVKTIADSDDLEDTYNSNISATINYQPSQRLHHCSATSESCTFSNLVAKYCTRCGKWINNTAEKGLHSCNTFTYPTQDSWICPDTSCSTHTAYNISNPNAVRDTAGHNHYGTFSDAIEWQCPYNNSNPIAFWTYKQSSTCTNTSTTYNTVCTGTHKFKCTVPIYQCSYSYDCPCTSETYNSTCTIGHNSYANASGTSYTATDTSIRVYDYKCTGCDCTGTYNEKHYSNCTQTFHHYFCNNCNAVMTDKSNHKHMSTYGEAGHKIKGPCSSTSYICSCGLTMYMSDITSHLSTPIDAATFTTYYKCDRCSSIFSGSQTCTVPCGRYTTTIYFCNYTTTTTTSFHPSGAPSGVTVTKQVSVCGCNSWSTARGGVHGGHYTCQKLIRFSCLNPNCTQTTSCTPTKFTYNPVGSSYGYVRASTGSLYPVTNKDYNPYTGNYVYYSGDMVALISSTTHEHTFRHSKEVTWQCTGYTYTGTEQGTRCKDTVGTAGISQVPLTATGYSYGDSHAHRWYCSSPYYVCTGCGVAGCTDTNHQACGGHNRSQSATHSHSIQCDAWKYQCNNSVLRNQSCICATGGCRESCTNYEYRAMPGQSHISNPSRLGNPSSNQHTYCINYNKEQWTTGHYWYHKRVHEVVSYADSISIITNPYASGISIPTGVTGITDPQINSSWKSSIAISGLQTSPAVTATTDFYEYINLFSSQFPTFSFVAHRDKALGTGTQELALAAYRSTPAAYTQVMQTVKTLFNNLFAYTYKPNVNPGSFSFNVAYTPLNYATRNYTVRCLESVQVKTFAKGSSPTLSATPAVTTGVRSYRPTIKVSLPGGDANSFTQPVNVRVIGSYLNTTNTAQTTSTNDSDAMFTTARTGNTSHDTGIFNDVSTSSLSFHPYYTMKYDSSASSRDNLVDVLAYRTCTLNAINTSGLQITSVDSSIEAPFSRDSADLTEPFSVLKAGMLYQFSSTITANISGTFYLLDPAYAIDPTAQRAANDAIVANFASNFDNVSITGITPEVYSNMYNASTAGSSVQFIRNIANTNPAEERMSFADGFPSVTAGTAEYSYAYLAGNSSGSRTINPANLSSKLPSTSVTINPVNNAANESLCALLEDRSTQVSYPWYEESFPGVIMVTMSKPVTIKLKTKPAMASLALSDAVTPINELALAVTSATRELFNQPATIINSKKGFVIGPELNIASLTLNNHTYSNISMLLKPIVFGIRGSVYDLT